MSARVEIDPNVRVKGNLTYAGFEDVVGGPVAVGDRVRVWEPESAISGYASVVEVDEQRELVYLDVNWSALRAPAALGQACPNSAPNQLRAEWGAALGTSLWTYGRAVVVRET